MTPWLAHQGGWDELLWFLVPVVVAIGAVRWAERRARARRTQETTQSGAEPDTAD